MSNEARWIDEVLEGLLCPMCGATYRRDDLSVEQPRAAQWSVTLCCHVCTRRALCILVREGSRPIAEPPVTIDDVLEAHDLLANHRGDMKSLLGAAG